MNILTISGGNRVNSFNTALLKALPELAPEHTFTLLDYSALPLYNQDLEVAFPESVEKIKSMIRSADGIIIATPEYNRTMPAALTNLLDWTSRPYGDGAWEGKKVYVFGATPGSTGTALAQADVRKSLLFLGALVMGQPESFIGSVAEKVSSEGVLTDENTKKHLASMLTAFAAFMAN